MVELCRECQRFHWIARRDGRPAGVLQRLHPVGGISVGVFVPLPDFAKWVLAAGMLLGRLELITVSLVFHPALGDDADSLFERHDALVDRVDKAEPLSARRVDEHVEAEPPRAEVHRERAFVDRHGTVSPAPT